jgi:hypothetical protein
VAHDPLKETIEKLEESLKVGGKEAFGARRVTFSVLHDDFGRYVIGTNSWSTDWLSLRLDQPVWRSYSERLDQFRSESYPGVSLLWEAYGDAESKFSHASFMMMIADLHPPGTEDGGSNNSFQKAIDEAKEVLAKAEKALLDGLGSERANELKTLWKSRRSSDATHPPKFDLHLIQRYVVKRVFDLGWTIERFEYFDNHVISYNGRNASKAERIGKKYQWIAYHEICALVADNFQFRNEMGSSGVEHAFQGPWQDYSRNLDPSHSLLSTKGDSESENGWWAPSFDPDWGEQQDGSSWAENFSDFPDLGSLVQKTDPSGRTWMVADLSFDRDRPVPEGMNRDEVERRKF